MLIELTIKINLESNEIVVKQSNEAEQLIINKVCNCKTSPVTIKENKSVQDTIRTESIKTNIVEDNVDTSWMELEKYSKAANCRSRIVNAWNNRKHLRYINSIRDLRNAILVSGESRIFNILLNEKGLGPKIVNHLMEISGF